MQRNEWKVHADVLKLAATEERKELIKWLHARRTFFSEADNCFAEGLELARDCKHEDARFLVSLFEDGPPPSHAEAQDMFVARSDDARCLCWAVECDAEPVDELLARSADKGYPWGMCLHSFRLLEKAEGEDSNDVVWLEKAVAGGEAEAMCALSLRLADERGKLLCREAALLGDPNAQCIFAHNWCEDQSAEQLMWLRRAALQHDVAALETAVFAARWHVKAYEQGAESGRAVLEIGAALKSSIEWVEGEVSRDRKAAEQCITLYESWCEEARRAVLCWLWLAKKKTLLIKDLRLLIADLIWDERFAWSEQARVEKRPSKKTRARK